MKKEIQELISRLEPGEVNNFFDLTCQRIQEKARVIAGNSDTISNSISGSFDCGFIAGYLSGKGKPHKEAVTEELEELLKELDSCIKFDRELQESIRTHNLPRITQEDMKNCKKKIPLLQKSGKLTKAESEYFLRQK